MGPRAPPTALLSPLQPPAGRRNRDNATAPRSGVPPPPFGGWVGGEERIGYPVLIPRFAELHRGLYSAAPYAAISEGHLIRLRKALVGNETLFGAGLSLVRSGLLHDGPPMV